MTIIRIPTVAALCAAVALAAAPLAAAAVDATVVVRAPSSPAAGKARTGDYKIVKRGSKVTRARCLEGGYVMVPSQGNATTAQRDHDIHEACKTVDYTK